MGCVLWPGNVNHNGYGITSYRGKTERAHRVTYMKAHGDIPEDLVVRHSCDNPRCINPEHLSLGSLSDNQLDCSTRRRRAVKLTEEEVLYIRNSQESSRSLGKRYNISHTVVLEIKRGKSRKEVI